MFTDQDKGFRLALPAGYVRITSKAQLAKVTRAATRWAKPADMTRQLSKSVTMLAINPTTGGSVNVVTADANGLTADLLPLVATNTEKRLKSVGGHDFTRKEATLGGETAMRASYTLKAADVSLTVVQYYAIHNNHLYVLSFAGGTNRGRSTLQKEIQASWGFLPMA